jgi:hypothetical protein
MRTVRSSPAAAVTAAATSSVERGTTARRGVALWLPAQFRHTGGLDGGIRRNLLTFVEVSASLGGPSAGTGPAAGLRGLLSTFVVPDPARGRDRPDFG